VPFIKQIGIGIKLLKKVPGATERADRLLRQKSHNPEGTIFELATAVRYAKDGFSVEFLPEIRGGERRPDLGIKYGNFLAEIECKRLQKGDYEKQESLHQRDLFRSFSKLVNERRLSFHVDVVYTQELKAIPVDYLGKWARKAMSSPFLLPTGFPWKDEYGHGLIKPADVDAVHRDTLNSSLLFGPKMARLLAGEMVFEGAYNLVASGKSDHRDARFVDQLHYGSVVTWQCVAERSIDARARFIQSKLSEVDKQLKSSPLGIVHIAMDAERDKGASDLRRARNIEVVKEFKFESKMVAGYLHYFVPRVTEVSSWMIDETVDRFGAGDIPFSWSGQIFDQSELLNNDLPAWHQPLPLPPILVV
jgi:hypothetical protein